MIPILYWPTDRDFTTAGLGGLSECVSCTVTEVRNDVYEAEFTYPESGRLFDKLRKGMIVVMTHGHAGDRQPFTIYRRSEPLNGLVTFYCHHVSYDANNCVVGPFTAIGAVGTVSAIESHFITASEFSLETDITSLAPFEWTVPAALRSVLLGDGGTVETFGGDLEFDGYTIRLLENRGEDKGVSIRYGKNLVSFEHEVDYTDGYNAVVPYWVNTSTGESIVGDIVTNTGIPDENGLLYTDHAGPLATDDGQLLLITTSFTKIRPLDLSYEFEEMPTADELAEVATAYLDAASPWLPTDSMSIDFVSLAQTEEYKDVAPLQEVNLCDYVDVAVPMYDISRKVKVIKTEYNVLADKYDRIELGDPAPTFAQTISASTGVAVARQINKELDQTGIFNRLTNFGSDQGLYIEDGKIYLNAEFLRGNTIEGLILRTLASENTYESESGCIYKFQFEFSDEGLKIQFVPVHVEDRVMWTSSPVSIIEPWIHTQSVFYPPGEEHEYDLLDEPIPYMSSVKLGEVYYDTEISGTTVTVSKTMDSLVRSIEAKAPLALFRTATYTYSYTVAANSVANITGTNLGVVTPYNCTPLAIRQVATGNNNVVVDAYNAAATGSETVLTVRNVSSASQTATATVEILYAYMATVS